MSHKGRISARFKVIAEIIAIEGKCPVYAVGDRIVVENDTVNTRETSGLCLPLLAGVMYSYQPFQYLGGGGTIHKCPMIGPPRGYGYVMYRYLTEPLEAGGS